VSPSTPHCAKVSHLVGATYWADFAQIAPHRVCANLSHLVMPTKWDEIAQTRALSVLALKGCQ
jgi:hypothetical protein